MIDGLKATNARLSQQFFERGKELIEVNEKLAEKERNERHVVARIATAAAQAKATTFKSKDHWAFKSESDRQTVVVPSLKSPFPAMEERRAGGLAGGEGVPS